MHAVLSLYGSNDDNSLLLFRIDLYYLALSLLSYLTYIRIKKIEKRENLYHNLASVIFRPFNSRKELHRFLSDRLEGVSRRQEKNRSTVSEQGLRGLILSLIDACVEEGCGIRGGVQMTIMEWAFETLKRAMGAGDKKLQFEGFEMVSRGGEEVWKPVM